MHPTTPGSRFLDAFISIENHVRASLQADESEPFVRLIRPYAKRKHLPERHVTELIVFAKLRNAIVHTEYYRGRPIADPVDEVVERIEQLWKLISSPPLALTVLGSRNVCRVHPTEQIRAALEYVRQFDYSQLPVYDETGYRGVLTTNTIARWLADQLSRNTGLAEEEQVQQVMRFAEENDRAPLVPRTITAAEAIDRLSQDPALIITQQGRTTDKPLAVLVPFDLPKLTAALAI